jgi:SAM-dependent methyltransferase
MAQIQGGHDNEERNSTSVAVSYACAMPRSVTETLTQQSAIVRRRLRDRIIGSERDRKTVREDIALSFLKGSGIEIGALNFPLRVPDWVNVRYVDYLPIETLLDHHAHLVRSGETLVAPDVVDDGERLESFPDESLDFVIANHFIEHSEDPIQTFTSHLRVIRPGGVLFMAVPDKRATFDHPRAVTSLEHLIRDHTDGPEVSRREHYLEWARLVDNVPDSEVERHADEQEARRFSIHFHVFTPDSFLQLLLHCRANGLPAELVLFQENGVEFVLVLRKTTQP